VIAGSTSNENDSPAATNSGDVLSKTTQRYLLVGNIQTTSHGVYNGLGLLKNFLLHEMVKCTLHNLLQFELDGLNSTHVGCAIILCQAVDVQLSFMDVSDIVILEVENLLGVLDNCRWVRGQEEFCWLRDSVIGKESTGLRPV
ncbi:hypothetical protein CV019_15045, partial [Staphylococcus haemolyticus]